MLCGLTCRKVQNDLLSETYFRRIPLATALSLSIPYRLRQMGYYCPEVGTTTANLVECGDPTVFCPEGSNKPVPVAAGYYSVGGGSDGVTRSSQVNLDGGKQWAEHSPLMRTERGGQYEHFFVSSVRATCVCVRACFLI